MFFQQEGKPNIQSHLPPFRPADTFPPQGASTPNPNLAAEGQGCFAPSGGKYKRGLFRRLLYYPRFRLFLYNIVNQDFPDYS